METNKNLLIAMQVIKDECIKHGKCEDCPVWEHLDDICEPHYWRIPTPPPEPMARQRIEWFRILPDDELIKVVFGNKGLSCSYCEGDSDEYCGLPCHERLLPWWHKEVTLEQFRHDVNLDYGETEE